MCWASGELQILALEDLRYGWIYAESLRKGELQDAIPILSFEVTLAKNKGSERQGPYGG